MTFGQLVELDKEIRSCTRCDDTLGRHPEDAPIKVDARVRPRPILSPPMQAPVMLIGHRPKPVSRLLH
jgi:hypothetical protein